MTYRGGGRVGGARGAKTTGCVKKAAKQDALTKALMAQDQAEVETSNSYVLGVVNGINSYYDDEDDDYEEEEEGASQASTLSEPAAATKSTATKKKLVLKQAILKIQCKLVT